jgi:hypothetical protein
MGMKKLALNATDSRDRMKLMVGEGSIPMDLNCTTAALSSSNPIWTKPIKILNENGVLYYISNP